MKDKFFLLKQIQYYEDKPIKGNFVLKGREVVEELNVIRWGVSSDSPDRRVNETFIRLPHKNWFMRWWSSRRLRVSTVFLGVDHGMGGALQVFETMVFEEGTDIYCRRCATYDEAEEQHDYIVECINEYGEL